MSRVTELAPQTSTRRALADRRSPSSAVCRDLHVAGSWEKDDSPVDLTIDRGTVNWTAVLGLGLVIGVSGGFWTAVVLMAKHIGR